MVETPRFHCQLFGSTTGSVIGPMPVRAHAKCTTRNAHESMELRHVGLGIHSERAATLLECAAASPPAGPVEPLPTEHCEGKRGRYGSTVDRRGVASPSPRRGLLGSLGAKAANGIFPGLLVIGRHHLSSRSMPLSVQRHSTRDLRGFRLFCSQDKQWLRNSVFPQGRERRRCGRDPLRPGSGAVSA